MRQIELHRQARPVLESLVRECNETADVAFLRYLKVIYLDAVQSTHLVRIVPRIGIAPPAFCTAAGKVLLAMENNGRVDLPSFEFRRYAPNTITDRDELKKQLETITAQGYALEDDELDIGVRGVAAPVRDYTGCVVGAISVSGPTMRVSDARMLNELVPMTQKAATEISLKAGYYSKAVAKTA